MMRNLDLFILEKVIKRKKSMFCEDLEKNKELLRKRIENKTVLVIGGAGSIGSAFIREIIQYGLSSLVVVDINENALTELTRELRNTISVRVPDDYKTYPMDYYSPEFERMFRNRGGFNIVANFSAHKHVRSEKDIYSIEALINNNVIHIKKLLDLLEEYPPEAYFCVSTDKAANPVNIMGASKRIMEEIIFAYAKSFPVKTARFANVAFSNGSLPDGFLKRIEKNQPLSVPSDVKRYFVSQEESGQICLISCILGGNKEILFPKLSQNQMITFGEIAENLLCENGFVQKIYTNPYDAIKAMQLVEQGGKEYPVYYSLSNTSGEKLYEEFYTKEEKIEMDRFKALGVIIGKKEKSKKEINEFISKLEELFDLREVTKKQIVDLIREFISDFNHIERNMTLDDKM